MRRVVKLGVVMSEIEREIVELEILLCIPVINGSTLSERLQTIRAHAKSATDNASSWRYRADLLQRENDRISKNIDQRDSQTQHELRLQLAKAVLGHEA